MKTLEAYLGQDGKFKLGDKVTVAHLPPSMSHFTRHKTYAVVIFTNAMHPIMREMHSNHYTLWFPENGNTSSWYGDDNLEHYVEVTK